MKNMEVIGTKYLNFQGQNQYNNVNHYIILSNISIKFQKNLRKYKKINNKWTIKIQIHLKTNNKSKQIKYSKYQGIRISIKKI